MNTFFANPAVAFLIGAFLTGIPLIFFLAKNYFSNQEEIETLKTTIRIDSIIAKNKILDFEEIVKLRNQQVIDLRELADKNSQTMQQQVIEILTLKKGLELNESNNRAQSVIITRLDKVIAKGQWRNEKGYLMPKGIYQMKSA